MRHGAIFWMSEGCQGSKVAVTGEVYRSLVMTGGESRARRPRKSVEVLQMNTAQNALRFKLSDLYRTAWSKACQGGGIRQSK